MEALLAKISVMLVPALLAVTFHEVAHGYIAERFGDPTARLLGRITLNPVRHLDPIGTLALIIVKFGWARPIPINLRNLRNPKKDMIWVALAGPVVNLSLAVVSALLLKVFSHLKDSGFFVSYETIFDPLGLMIAFSLYVNVILGILNLLPIPPLDGGRVLSGLLPDKFDRIFVRVEFLGFFIVIFLFFFTPLWTVFFQPLVIALVRFLAGDEFHIVVNTLEFLQF